MLMSAVLFLLLNSSHMRWVLCWPDVPKLPPLPGGEGQAEEEEEEDDESPSSKPSKQRRPSGPRAKDPYAGDDTSTMLLPVFVAIGAFIPLLFCLCKL